MGLFDFTEETHLAAAGRLPGTALTDDGKTKKRKHIKIFRSDWLERWFGTAHPLTPGIWTPLVTYAVYAGVNGSLGWLRTVLLFCGGVLLTTLIEYFLHRVLFHLEPKNHGDQLRHFIMHGYHHDFPNDGRRLVLPLSFILPMAAVTSGIYWLGFGDVWLQVFAGTAAGYMLYDWVHYYTHHFHPKRGIGKWLKRYHLLHHFDSPNHRFGISSPLWDLVFGTYLSSDKRMRQMHADRARKDVAEPTTRRDRQTAGRFGCR